MTLFTLLFSIAAAASAQAPAGGLTRIGAAAAVRGAVKAQAPGQAVGRVLGSGKPVFLNDHVTTDAAGRLQVLLLDETVFTIGPNSDMVLDEFVYDPVTSAGKVTAQVTKGVFRFVTGKVARKDPGSMRVKLPVGTIGIRGTIAGGQVSGQGSTVILFGPGANNNANENPGSVSVENAGGQVVITQPGFGTTILPGQAPSGATNMSGQAQAISNALGEPAPQGGSSSGGSGGDSAGQQAGQDTAAGGVSAGISGDLGDFAGTLDATQSLASQAATAASIVDGISSWADVRTVSGSGYYSGSGSYSCTGTMSCSSGGSGSISVYMPINFASRTIGDPASSQIQISGTLNNYVRLKTIDFTSLSGNAAIPLNYAGGSGNTTRDASPALAAYFNNTILTLNNSGGVAAQNMKVVLNYNDTSDAISGATANAALVK